MLVKKGSFQEISVICLSVLFKTTAQEINCKNLPEYIDSH